MTKVNRRFITAFVIGLIVSTGVFAQKKGQHQVDTAIADKYIISAKAGRVNYVSGTVTVFRSDHTGGQLLKGDDIEIGDKVSTAADGRIEVLLNPGSYVRVGANSTFEFRSTDLEDLKIKLEKGSAMFEVFAADDFTVSVYTPTGKAVLIESGVYRIDVNSDGTSTIAVSEGKANVGLAKPIKGGRAALIGVASATAVKFDRGKRDDLAEWSRSRAKGLASMTASLQNDNVRHSLLTSFNGGGWGVYNSFGLWVFNPFLGSYCFLPFGYDWYSPYGHSYRNGLYWYRMPPTVYTPPVYTPPVNQTRIRPNRVADIPPYETMGGSRGPIRQADAQIPDASTPGRFPSGSPASMPTSMPSPVYVPSTSPRAAAGSAAPDNR